MKVKLSVTRSSQSQRLVPGLHLRHRHRHRRRPRAHLRPRQARPFRYARRIDFSGAFTRDYRLVGDARSITRIVMATEIASATRYHHVPSNCQCSAPALHPLPLCSRPALTSHSCLAHPPPSWVNLLQMHIQLLRFPKLALGRGQLNYTRQYINRYHNQTILGIITKWSMPCPRRL